MTVSHCITNSRAEARDQEKLDHDGQISGILRFRSGSQYPQSYKSPDLKSRGSIPLDELIGHCPGDIEDVAHTLTLEKFLWGIRNTCYYSFSGHDIPFY